MYRKVAYWLSAGKTAIKSMPVTFLTNCKQESIGYLQLMASFITNARFFWIELWRKVLWYSVSTELWHYYFWVFFFKHTLLLIASSHLLHHPLHQYYLVYFFLCSLLLIIFQTSLKSIKISFKKFLIL